MSPLHSLARSFIAPTFLATGIEAVRNPETKTAAVERIVPRLNQMGITQTPEQLVRMNGGVQVAAGPPNGPDIAPTRVLIRGDYRQPGEAVEPGFPSAVTGHQKAAEIIADRYRQFPTRGLRLTLAKWIASKENPLTARVWVNRMWQYHFGQGIVRTTSDFGRNGDKPSHPELLDYLANRFMDEGWDVKAMHRLMVTSATYRQAADHPTLSESTKDPGNRLLWKFNRRRLLRLFNRKKSNY